MSETPALNETALKSLQDRAKDPTLVPGSDEEKAIRDEVRALREQTTGEFAAVHGSELAARATPEGIVHTTAARYAGHTALGKVTSAEMDLPTDAELADVSAQMATEQGQAVFYDQEAQAEPAAIYDQEAQ